MDKYAVDYATQNTPAEEPRLNLILGRLQSIDGHLANIEGMVGNTVDRLFGGELKAAESGKNPIAGGGKLDAIDRELGNIESTLADIQSKVKKLSQA